MKSFAHSLIAVLVASLCAGQALALTKDEYKAGKDRIEAEYKTAKEQCKSMNGNAKDVCEEEAAGKEKVARAELEAAYRPTPRNQEKVRVARADAAYEVAKEKCDELAAEAKSNCEKDAKAAHKTGLQQARSAKP